MTSTSFLFTEQANTMKYGGGFLYNLVFTEWRHCFSQNEVWGRGCYITLFSPSDVTAFHWSRLGHSRFSFNYSAPVFHKTLGVGPMLGWCWGSVVDDGSSGVASHAVNTKKLYSIYTMLDNVKDVGATLYKCYTNVFCLLGYTAYLK